MAVAAAAGLDAADTDAVFEAGTEIVTADAAALGTDATAAVAAVCFAAKIPGRPNWLLT